MKRKQRNLANLLTNRKVKLDIRKRVFNSDEWSILLYSCEKLAISKNMENKIYEIYLQRTQVFNVGAIDARNATICL